MSTTNGGGDGLGKLIAAGLGLYVGVKMIEGGTGRSIWDVLGELAAAEAVRKRQRLAEEERKRVQQALAAPPPIQLPAPATPGILQIRLPDTMSATSQRTALPSVAPEPDAAWRQKIVHPSVVLIVGKRGSGKSVLGYRLLELYRYQLRPYVVGVPASARKQLPDWIGIAPTLEEVPHKAIALVDEAYLAYHARGSMARESKAMSQMLNLSRQKEQTLIFVSQEARQVDKNIASSANVLVFKDLGILQVAFDRPELNKLTEQAREAFARVADAKRRWAYVYAPDSDFVGLLPNALPSFWKPGLSRLFAAEAPPAQPRAAKSMTAQEKAVRAKALKATGASYKDIADALGVTRGTVLNYLKDYPYKR